LGARERREYTPVATLQGDEAELLALTFNAIPLATPKQARDMLVAGLPCRPKSAQLIVFSGTRSIWA
jgi:hypothetical protein